MTLTTAQMDSAEGVDRGDLWVQCSECAEWNHYHDTIEKCQHCGGTRFNPQTTISARTFSVERAKAATAKLKRKLKK
jgi:hypothetical protein